MLILHFMRFIPTPIVNHKLLKLLNLHLVLYLFICYQPKVLTQLRITFKLSHPLQILVIELKVSVNQLLKEHLIVLNKGCHTCLRI